MRIDSKRQYMRIYSKRQYINRFWFTTPGE